MKAILKPTLKNAVGPMNLKGVWRGSIFQQTHFPMPKFCQGQEAQRPIQMEGRRRRRTARVSKRMGLQLRMPDKRKMPELNLIPLLSSTQSTITIQKRVCLSTRATALMQYTAQLWAPTRICGHSSVPKLTGRLLDGPKQEDLAQPPLQSCLQLKG